MSAMEDFLDFIEARAVKDIAASKVTAAANRRVCQQEGHQYRLHATKAAPTRVTCKRCKVEWSIGPRTEPPA